jgi:branched-chain amino acid transport system permease protein
MLTGIVQPDSGAIRFLGRDTIGMPAHAICALGMGRTFQNLRLFGDLSVLDNVMLGRHARMRNGFWASLMSSPGARRSEAAAREHAMSLLDMLGLGSMADTPAGSPPAGLQRRVDWAQRCAATPVLLPTTRRRTQPAGDGGTGTPARAHRWTRREHPDGGAPHGPVMSVSDPHH